MFRFVFLKKSVHENWVRSVLVHPSGAFILSASDDRSIRVFDMKVRRSILIAWCLLRRWGAGGRG